MAYWLSEPIEKLIDVMQGDRREEVCEVLVVGSGYGGAIAALRLAGEGRKVLLFERGKEYALGDFPENLGELPGHVRFMRPSDKQPVGYADALFDLRISDKVAALVGNGLGGTSLINANVAIKPDKETLRHPAWPKGLREHPETLFKAMKCAADLLGVDYDRENPGKLQALCRIAQAVKVDCELAPITVSFVGGRNAVGVEQAPCVRCGNCVTGCNVGAKNTLPMNLLPLARARGARFYTGATVLSVEPTDDAAGKAGWTVRFRRTATEKHVLRDEVHCIRAGAVILAAGTFGSTEILLRSQALMKIRCSPQLGKRFSTNGDTIAFGYGQRSRVGAVATSGSLDPEPKHVGPTISGYAKLKFPARENAPAHELLLEDGAVPVSLARVFSELAVTGSLVKRYVNLRDPAWFDAHRDSDRLGIHGDALQHSQLLLGMGDDGAAGELLLKMPGGEVDARNADDARLDIVWPQGEGSKASMLLDATERALQDVESDAFDRGDFIQNPLSRPLPAGFAENLTGDPPQGPLLTVHPLGGCPMGDDAKSGVVNEFGQVYRLHRGVDGKPAESLYAGLYVMDGAIIPRALGVNPFLTICGLAWRASDKLLATRGWTVSTISRADLDKPPRSRRLVPASKPLVKAQIMERLLGNAGVQIPAWFRAKAEKHELARRDWLAAEITIEFCDLDAWLANPGQALKAECKLFANSSDWEMFDPTYLKEIATSITGTVALLAPDGPRNESEADNRATSALLAYVQRNGLPKSKDRSGNVMDGLWRVARNHAHWRVLDYHFTFERPDGKRDWVLKGRKELAYHADKPNVWTALVDLPVDFAPLHATIDERYRGVLKVDLADLTKRALAQVRNEVHTPAALMAIIGVGMLFIRVLFQTHFWSFRAPDYTEARPAGNRDPQPISVRGGLVKPERVPLLVPAGLEGEEPLQLRLWRYPNPGAPRASKVLLIHGLAHGANVFATRSIRRPLAAYLHDQGHEVWLLDYRLSPALEQASRRQSTMDEIARYDIAEAVRYVYREAGEPIRVFAHCIGAGCFSMSVLGGHCNDRAGNSMIKAAAIHAVPPWLVASKANRLRANLAAFVQDVIGEILVDPIPPAEAKASFRETLIDRLAGSLPWPQAELKLHNLHRGDEGMGRAICNRMTLFYGVEWVHANLSEATHRELAKLVGVGNIETFRQIFFLIQRGRMTDRHGNNTYLKSWNITRHWKFPTLFAHGSENQVFSPLSSRRSAAGLAHVHQGDYDVFYEEIPGYGHMDFLFGERAHIDVYPKIGKFFAGEGGSRLRPAAPIADGNPDAPDEEPVGAVTGPIIGGAYLEKNEARLHVWIEAHDDVTFKPVDVKLVARLRDGGVRNLAWSELTLHTSFYEGHWYLITEVPVPREIVALEVTVDYQDPDQDPGESPAPVAIAKSSAAFAFARTATRVPDTADVLDLDAPWFRRIAGLEPRRGCTFLAGSCRHPGSPFEREASDAVFCAMVEAVKDGADHVLFVGDQIYADATADAFDTNEPGERYTGRYRTAFSSPAMRQLLRSVPVTMAIDDHEFSDNWDGLPADTASEAEQEARRAWRTPDRWTLFRVARDAAKNNQRALSRPFDLTSENLWHDFASAGLPFFVMDTRSERRPRARDMGPQQAKMVLDEQMRALEKWLQDLTGDEPKFIVCGSPIGPLQRDPSDHASLWRNADSWFGYPATLDCLAHIMARTPRKNIVFLAGDYHFSATADLVFYCDGKPSAEAKQIIASGLFSPMPFANERREDFRWDRWCAFPVAGSKTKIGVKASLLAYQRRHFLRVAALPGTSGWEVNVTAIGADGNEICGVRIL